MEEEQTDADASNQATLSTKWQIDTSFNDAEDEYDSDEPLRKKTKRLALV